MISEPRDLPQVEILARAADGLAPGPVVRSEARRVIDRARGQLDVSPTSMAKLERELVVNVAARSPLRRVVNATGVLLHTNLGRAPLDPLPDERDGLGTVPLELDVRDGRRGRRLAGLEADLCDLTGAESALVVNNNAGALLLVLSALAAGGEVVVSRGQLVEIGGSFRVPEIVSQGGAVLREVGTTNRTHLADYRNAIGEATRALLEVHPSNFAQVGFVTAVPTAEIAALAREHGLSMVHDIGSGLVDARTPWLEGDTPPWLADEPAARQVLDSGATAVTFSGDKLLGGPQAGIICGRASALDAIRRHPLSRALRYDKIRAAHLHATVRAHLDGSAATTVPFYRMATASLGELEHRARAVSAALASGGVAAEVVEVEDSAGAGSAPNQIIPGWAVAVATDSPAEVAASLRHVDPPVLAVVRNGQVRLSTRTIDPADDEAVVRSVIASTAARPDLPGE